MTTYSTSLKLALIGDGQESGTWGQTTNTNLGTLLEEAITGYVAIDMANANVTLTSLNGTFDQARNAVIELTGTNSAVRDVIPPVVKKLYTIVNSTAGGFAIRVIGATGTGINVPNGATVLVYCDGTNFVNGLSGTAGNFSVAGNITTTGNVSVTGAFVGNGASISTINASNISSGTVATARLGSGTANSSTFLRGDQTYGLPSSITATNFTIKQVGDALVFQYNGANVAVMDSGGNLTSSGQFVAGGSV
jgi:hypothetical protein